MRDMTKMNRKNLKNLYFSLVDSFLLDVLTKTEINNILSEFDLPEITSEIIRKTMREIQEREEKKKKFNEEWDKRKKEERAKRDEELRRNAMKMKMYGYAIP